MVNSESMLFT